jgi:molybdenum cofactor sulfurtransferase
LKTSLNKYIGFDFVDKLAQQYHIHLRTGCFCNIGGCNLNIPSLSYQRKSANSFNTHKCGDHIDLINGIPTGAIRVSFGYCTLQFDIDKFILFLSENFIENQIDDNKTKDNSNVNHKYFKITNLFIYPIKSGAPMIIDESWPLESNGSLKFDRQWIIIDSNGVPLSQKRWPNIVRLETVINLKRNKIILKYDEHLFELDLILDTLTLKEFKIKIYMNDITGYDQGCEVSKWLTKVLKTEKCRLIRISNDDNDKSFVNKAQYLLINEASIIKLWQSIMNENYQFNDYQLLRLFLQFRPNIVVRTLKDDNRNAENDNKTNFLSSFDEESWKNLKIINRNLEFKVEENCSRCQMINIPQSLKRVENEEEMNSNFDSRISMLLKKLYSLKSNSKFGIYLSSVSSLKKENKINDSNIELFSIEQHQRLSVGDIGLIS